MQIDDFNINKPAANRYIYARDDGLLRGNTTGNKFVVFADSAPPKPDIDKDKLGNGVTNIKWSNKVQKTDKKHNLQFSTLRWRTSVFVPVYCKQRSAHTEVLRYLFNCPTEARRSEAT